MKLYTVRVTESSLLLIHETATNQLEWSAWPLNKLLDIAQIKAIFAPWNRSGWNTRTIPEDLLDMILTIMKSEEKSLEDPVKQALCRACIQELEGKKAVK